MKIVIHTQYFLPEMGAPQARLSELANFFSKKGIDVTILTAMPNYPAGKIYNGYGGFYKTEIIDGLKVIRCFIYPSNSSNVFKRLFSYLSFTLSSLIIGLFVLPKCDYILSESPPLFIGISGYLLSLTKKAKWIFNISDLWPESALILGIINKGIAYKLSTKLEEYLYKKAHLITCQSKEITNNIKLRISNEKVILFSNGVDIKKFHKKNSSNILKKWSNGKKYTAVYAGLHGLAQGLDQIVLAAKILSKSNFDLQFIFIGDGLEKERLIKLSKSLKLDNISFVDPQDKKNMPAIWASADLAMICLKKYILGAVPSKLYEAMASSCPIIFIGDGEPREIIHKANCGYSIYPREIDNISISISKMINDNKKRKVASENARKYVVENFNREKIMTNLLEDFKRNENN